MRFSDGKQSNRIIKVTGEASVSIKPDIAVLSVKISRLSQNYAEAVDQLETGVNEIKTAVSKLHIDVNQLKTASFNVNSEYEGYSDDNGVWKNRFVGYSASESLKLEIPLDNKLLANLLNAVAESSCNPELYISFSVKDKTKAKDRVIAKAVKDSARKAKLLTDAAGVALGEIVAINYSFGETALISPTVYNRDAGAMLCKASANEITPEDITVSDSVSVVWEIK